MQAHLAPEVTDRSRALILGGVLIAIGLVAFAMQQTGIDVTDWLGGSGWTLFILVPGVALLLAAIVAEDGPAQGLTTAGAIVTTVGGLLLYQDQTGNYESWAYAWALIPMAVGASLIVHGLRVGRPDLVGVGARMVAILGVVLVAGAWYFESIFRTGRVPFDLGDAWPLAIVGVGVIVLLYSLLKPARTEEMR